jgi:class 3 adenylate cyclase
MRKNIEGKLSFVVDAEEKQSDMSHVGDIYENVTPAMLASFDTPFKITVEQNFGSDKWGAWLSCYAPFYTSDGKVEGILGVDMSAEKVLAYEQKYLTTIIIVSLMVSMLGAILGFYFSRRISKPLKLLEYDMQEIQRFDLDSDVPIVSRISEVITMKAAVDNMKSGLKSFKKYVPSELVADLIRLKKEAVLEAEKREITILFSDIADFTTISEQTPPEQLADNLGDYFRGMTQTILGNHGTVDKFIGDAIMAFWNAPNKVGNHTLMACRSALQCQQFLTGLEARWRGSGKPVFTTRIGINSGEAIVGNMGYEERMSYTAIGDNVNLASRLEGLNKYYGTKIILGENAYKQVKDLVVARLVDIVAVKGKNTSIRIYNLMAEKDSADKNLIKLASDCNEAMDYYLHRQWKKAITLFEECAHTETVAQSCRIIIDRCRKFEITPPSDDWCGTIVMREK